MDYFDRWSYENHIDEYSESEFLDGYYDMIAEDCREEYPDDFGNSFE